MNPDLSVVDLFAGAGGMSLGFHAAGMQSAASVEYDERAAATYDRNFSLLQPTQPPDVHGGAEADLRTFNLKALGQKHRPDLVIGGPPCQGYSKIGRGKLNDLSEEGFEGDPRNDLYLKFVEAIDLWRPAAFVMENVPGMLSVAGVNMADHIASDLEGCGYKVRYALLNAAWYGVPQRRERLFFIGFRSDLGLEPAAPAPTHHPEALGGYIHRDSPITLPFAFMPNYRLEVDNREAPEAAVTVEEAIGDLPKILEHLQLTSRPGAKGFRSVRKYEVEPHSEYARLMRRWEGFSEPPDMDDHEVRRTPRDYRTFERMEPGDRYPEAVRIAWQLAEQELARARESGEDVQEGSPEHARIVRAIVPPYGDAWALKERGELRQGFPDRWRKLHPDQPSWTLPAHLAKDTYSHIHYDSAQRRMISVREAARLQSFPDAFRFEGNMGDCFRQIGNAVPPLLARAIASEVRTRLGV